MPPIADTEELFVLGLLLAGYVAVVRAYARDRSAKWLFFGFTALLVGRISTVLEETFLSPLWVVPEHGVGVGLAGLCFLLHFYTLATGSDERAADVGTSDGSPAAES